MDNGFKQGKKMEVPGNFHLSLHEKGAVWFLENGTVNLFAIELKNGSAIGPRTLIGHFCSPCLLFDMSDSQMSYAMTAISENRCVIWKMALNEVKTISVQSPFLLNDWINQLALFFRRDAQTETDEYFLAPETIDLQKGKTLSIKRAIAHAEKKRINWIRIQRGEVEFLGYPSLLLDAQSGVFPLTSNAWMKAKEDVKIDAADSAEDWQQGLALFHHILYAYLICLKAKNEEEEAKRFEKRSREEQKNISLSLQEMVDVINPIEFLEVEGSANTFFQACQIIGRFMEIPFHCPENLNTKIVLAKATDVIPIVSAISQDSGVRYRQVHLIRDWWKKDCGPMLAFYEEGMKPVALIDKTPGRYALIDPETNLHVKVDGEVAGKLSPIAFCFYHSFPDELKTGKEVIGFYFKHNLKEFKPLLVYSIIAALIALFPPFATEILFNRVIPETNFSLFWQIGFGLFLAAITSSLFLFFRSLVIVRIEGRSSNQIQLGLWDRLLKLPPSFFRRYTTGNLILRVMSTEEIRSLLSGNAARVMLSGIFSVFYIIAMFIYAPSLTFIGIGIIVLSLVVTLFCARVIVRLRKKILELQGNINSFLVQVISAVGKLRTTGTEKNVFSRWASLFAKNKKLELHSQHIQNIVTVCNYILPFFSFASIFAFTIASKTHFSIGAFLAFNAAFITFYLAVTDLSNTLMQMAPVFPLWERSKVIVEQPQETSLNKKKPGILTGEISIDDLSFKYEENGPLILDNISIKVNPKEFVGIVGPSGCGKSTLVRLLLGFEKPSSGAIFYNEKDLASLAIQELRKQLGIVLQDEGIVSGTIYDNLVCGGVYSLEQIDHAFKVSGFIEDIDTFPMGLHTYLSMGGSTLSGGQKQRLLIARALLPNPKILILDEATSALDNKNQETVMESLNQLDVTRIVIAHRLSTIRSADRIYVLDRGKIVQAGTFEEISSQSGLFAEMLKRQKL